MKTSLQKVYLNIANVYHETSVKEFHTCTSVQKVCPKQYKSKATATKSLWLSLLGLESTLCAENPKKIQYDHTEELQTYCHEWLLYSLDQLYFLSKCREIETIFRADAKDRWYSFIIDDCCTFPLANYDSSFFVCVFPSAHGFLQATGNS